MSDRNVFSTSLTAYFSFHRRGNTNDNENLSGCRGECLLQVIDDVIDVFDTDRNSHVFGDDACLLLFFGRQLLVRRTCRMNHQGLGVTDVGKV